MSLVDEILKSRGYSTKAAREAFLSPNYETEKHDPFLLPDMEKAVERLVAAYEKKDRIVIYGDYDIDGLTASTVLLDSFEKFGLNASVFIPNRFIEGYGLSGAAIEKLAENGAQLIITVDCGSLSHKEIKLANSLGVDVIVTDHHSVAETMPPAVAVINPKRNDHKYPFVDLAGVGVAFKLVQALQTKLEGLPMGQEKWLLDLVALGTVCDVVELKGENRANVYWGLKVMQKTRRPGLKMLMLVARVEPGKLKARTLGFVLGPRLNASGRLETAQIALDLLVASDRKEALGLAERLEAMNVARRAEQDRIFKEASLQAAGFENNPVLVVSEASWSHGIIGIVAAKLLEQYHKPTFVLQELEDGTSKGSARSFGDFSAVEGIRATDDLIIKGGGHKLAAGVTIETSKLGEWRQAINNFYSSLKLSDQEKYLHPKEDVVIDDFSSLDEDLWNGLGALEPFGNGNPEPVFRFNNAYISGRRTMGDNSQHLRLTFQDAKGSSFQTVSWNSADKFMAQIGETADVWFELTLNEWRGRRNVEGRILNTEPSFSASEL